MSKRRGRGEGSVAQRADGLWEARISIGNGKRKSLYAKTKQDALRKVDTLKARLLNGNRPQVDRSSVSEYLDRWLESIEVRPKTLAQYKGIVEGHIKPAIGFARLQTLSADAVQTMLDGMKKDGASPRLRELTYVVLKCALNRALKMGKLELNVCNAVDRPRVPAHEMQVLDEAQAAKLMERATNLRLRALFGLALETGMRFGELLGLQWRDVALGDSGSITVRHTLQDLAGKVELAEPKTKSAQRTIRLSTEAVDALEEHRVRMKREKHRVTDLAPVFCDRDGGWLRQNNVSRRALKSLLKKAKLPMLRFHDLRHTAATLMLARGVNAQVVSRKLGHEDIVVTLKVYGHLLPSMEEHAAATMATAYSRLWAA